LPGDIFWEVNGEAVIGMNQTDLAAAVRGPAGTDVNITFKRGEDMIEMTITRVRFQVPNIETEILDNNIAYISMAEFTALAREQVDAALDELDVNSRTGLIFDLRGNPGGLLTSAVDMGSLFIEEGVLLYEAFADGSEEIFQASGDYGNITVPIVVLIDETSASASELIAGAIKDTGVATLIGETTFGKGTVQNIQPLSNNGGIRLTVARWLTPNRNWIHEVGVTPDIVVDWDPQTAEDFAAPDPQLQAAVDFLLSQ
jgi:carboxyl-terminal processing protease